MSQILLVLISHLIGNGLSHQVEHSEGHLCVHEWVCVCVGVAEVCGEHGLGRLED